MTPRSSSVIPKSFSSIGPNLHRQCKKNYHLNDRPRIMGKPHAILGKVVPTLVLVVLVLLYLSPKAQLPFASTSLTQYPCGRPCILLNLEHKRSAMTSTCPEGNLVRVLTALEAVFRVASELQACSWSGENSAASKSVRAREQYANSSA